MAKLTFYSECCTQGDTDCPSCMTWTVLHVMGQEESGGTEYCPAHLRTLNLHAGFETVPGLYHLPRDTSAWCILMQVLIDQREEDTRSISVF